MKIKMSFVLLAVSFAFGLIKQFAPDFPLSSDVFLALVVFIIGLFGVQVEEGLIRAGLI